MRKKGEPFNRLAWLEDADVRERSKKQERRVAKQTGGSPQRASGATSFRKGDINAVPSASVPLGRLKLETKTTKDLSYRLQYSDLKKIEEEAIQDGQIGAMVITFADRHDYLVIRKDYVEFEGSKP